MYLLAALFKDDLSVFTSLLYRLINKIDENGIVIALVGVIFAVLFVGTVKRNSGV